jgi:VWFA-related protein
VHKPVAILSLVGLCGLAVAAQQAPPSQPPVSSRTAAVQQATPDPQMPAITFRSEVNYVEVDVRVVDPAGNFVRNLRQDEFELFENGEQQAVAAFSLVDIPITKTPQPLFAAKPIELDTRTNASGPEGRVYVIVLDDLHTSMMNTTHVRRAARQFIQRNLGANDVAAVVHTSGRTTAGQEFTSSQRLITEAIDTFAGRKLRSSTLEKIDEYSRNRNLNSRGSESSNPYDKLKDPLDFERAFNARSLLETIGNISKMMAGVSGRRKAVLLFSEGIDYDVTDFMNKQDAIAILDQTRDAITEATRANVNVYAIDPRGLAAYGEEGIEIQVPMDADPNLHLGMEGLDDERRLAHSSLRTIADETGGFAALNTNDFSTAFQRIVDENSSYYVMGYHPSNEKRDGRFRRIEVRVTRPGLRVTARRGYLAPRGRVRAPKLDTKSGTPPELVAALNSPLQTGGLPLSIAAAPFRGPGVTAAVALVTQTGPLQGIPFTEKDGKSVNKIDLSVIAIDANGKVRGGSREVIDLTLRPDTRERADQLGFRFLSRFEVPPGKYQLRIAAKEKGGLVGSVYYDLDIPDFTKEPLSMSGLVVTSALAGLVPTAGEIPEIKGMLKAPPTVARVFNARDQVGVLAEIYDTKGGLSHSVDVTTTVRGDDGKVLFSTSETRASSELGGVSGGYGCTTIIPLKEFAEGLYVVRMEAKSTLKDGGQASREVLIRIVR